MFGLQDANGLTNCKGKLCSVTTARNIPKQRQKATVISVAFLCMGMTIIPSMIRIVK